MSEKSNSANENDRNNDVVEVKIKTEPDVIEIRDDDDISELEHLRKLFIGGLTPYTNEASLKAFYAQFGNVVDVVVMRDPNTKRSRGFGFVTYSKSKMVDLAQSKRPHVVDGKTVDSKRALQRPDRENREMNVTVKKLFVGGLKEIHDEENLTDYFSKFGKVISVKLLTDRNTGKRRGFAFVEFDDYDSVDKAMIQGQHTIKNVVVDVKKSVYKQDMKTRQQNRFENASSNVPTTNNFGNQMRKPMNSGMLNGPPPNQMPKPPQVMPPGPMNGFPSGPPPNYNYFCPPPPVQPYGNGYQQGPPPHPPTNNWNYPPTPNNWQQPPPPAGWQPNNWGYGPPQGPPPPAWNGPPVPPGQHLPPPVQPNAPSQTQPPPNFGTGYQQNYGGGPDKHATNANRSNPYDRPNSTNGYGNKSQLPPPGYAMNSVPAATPVPPVGGNYRR